MTELLDLQEHLNILKKQIELKNQTELLLKDPRFIEVILKGFCEDEMHRNMGLAVCDKLPEDLRELCNNLAKASAALHNYLNTTIQIGLNAEEDLKEVDEQIQQLQMQEDK